jgi:hypothetical protein
VHRKANYDCGTLILDGCVAHLRVLMLETLSPDGRGQSLKLNRSSRGSASHHKKLVDVVSDGQPATAKMTQPIYKREEPNMANTPNDGNLRRYAIVILSTTLAMSAPLATLNGQALSPDLLARIQRGAASVTLEGGRSTVPLVGPPTLPLVEVRLNGMGPYRLLVDLGSNIFLLRRAVAERVGARTLLHRDAKDRDIIECDSLRVGGALFRSVVGGQYETLDVDGVIGYHMLTNLVITLDYPNRQFSLSRDSIGPASTQDRQVPYVELGRLPAVPVHIKGRTWSFLLDTGASGTFDIPADSSRSLSFAQPPVSGKVAWNNQTGSSQTLIGRLAGSVVIGSIVVPNPEVVLDPALGMPQLGSGWLQQFRVTIDTHHRVVRFARPADDWPSDERDCSRDTALRP